LHDAYSRIIEFIQRFIISISNRTILKLFSEVID